MDENGLSIKQQRACNYYLSGISMRKSLVMAGYSKSYADHVGILFLKSKKVIEYIRRRQKEEADAALTDAIFIKSKLKKLCEHEDPNVCLDALKQLDNHNKWVKELENKLKEIEEGKSEAKSIQININEIKNEDKC